MARKIKVIIDIDAHGYAEVRGKHSIEDLREVQIACAAQAKRQELASRASRKKFRREPAGTAEFLAGTINR